MKHGQGVTKRAVHRPTSSRQTSQSNSHFSALHQAAHTSAARSSSQSLDLNIAQLTSLHGLSASEDFEIALVNLTRECIEQADGRCLSSASAGSMLRDLATRRCLLARLEGGVKSVSEYMKKRWGSLEGFVQAHASAGLRLGTDGMLRFQEPLQEEAVPLQLSVDTSTHLPNRATMNEMPLNLSQLLRM